jgi:hypothetical protein
MAQATVERSSAIAQIDRDRRNPKVFEPEV